jgi:hypothetical protein
LIDLLCARMRRRNRADLVFAASSKGVWLFLLLVTVKHREFRCGVVRPTTSNRRRFSVTSHVVLAVGGGGRVDPPRRCNLRLCSSYNSTTVILGVGEKEK